MRTIILGSRNQYETFVSDEDYDFLIKWKWNYLRSRWAQGGKIYARRTGTGPTTILLHHVILIDRMGLIKPVGHTGDHIDRNTLNNQRSNLRWSTPSRQRHNQDRHIEYLSQKEPDHGLDEIPY